jgi:hypothetical protein
MAVRTIFDMSEEELLAVYANPEDGEGASRRIKALVSRLHAAIESGKAEREQREQLEAGLEARLEAAKTEALEAANTGFERQLATRDEDLALSRIGITDPDAVMLLRRKYETLPEDNRPALADFAKRMKEDPKARKAAQLSPTLEAALGTKPSEGPSLSEESGDPGEVNVERVQAAFAGGREEVDKMLARFRA